MEITLIRTQQGFAPADDDAREDLRHFKLGSIARLEVKLMRNGAFFRKWWALVKLGYDYWSDASKTTTYKGQAVLPEFDRFRKDVTILAGFYRPVANIRGDVRLEPESLQWASMTEERFGKLYDATIQVLLKQVFNGQVCREWSEEELRAVASQILEFAA